MRIGMYSSDEIYDELANGFLHHSMVDAMYFEIKKLREENKRLEDIIGKTREYIENNQSGGMKNDGSFYLNFDGDIWEVYDMLKRY